MTENGFTPLLTPHEATADLLRFSKDKDTIIEDIREQSRKLAAAKNLLKRAEAKQYAIAVKVEKIKTESGRSKWVECETLDEAEAYDEAKIMLNAEQMRSLPQCFTLIVDPRRSQGRRHRLPVVLGIAAGAMLCGMDGYKAISDWADALGQKARERFGCRRENRRYVVPSEFVIRDCLIRIEPGVLDQALNAWNQAWGVQDDALAIDGKTMKNAIDEAGHQTHIMSVVGHDSKSCHTQKKSAPYP